MRFALSAFVVMTCVLLYTADTARGQVQQGVTVQFANNSHTGVIVKGYSILPGNIKVAGPIIPIKKGGLAFEAKVPAGIRYYTVYDAVNPTQILLQDHAVLIQNRDVPLVIMQSPIMPNRVVIVQGK